MKPRRLLVFVLSAAAASCLPYAAAALDIHQVQLLVEATRIDGQASGCLLFFVGVIGDSTLQGATFTPPPPAAQVPIDVDQGARGR